MSDKIMTARYQDCIRECKQLRESRDALLTVLNDYVDKCIWKSDAWILPDQDAHDFYALATEAIANAEKLAKN